MPEPVVEPDTSGPGRDARPDRVPSRNPSRRARRLPPSAETRTVPEAGPRRRAEAGPGDSEARARRRRVRRGTRETWVGLADGSPAEAEKLFVRALALEPGNDDANYGYGYVLLQRNKAIEAAPYLCRARRSKQADIRQDVNGLITSYGVSLPVSRTRRSG